MAVNLFACVIVEYSVENRDKKTCDIIVSVNNSRLFIQVVTIENKRHRRRCCAQKGEAVLSKEKGLSSEIRYVVELLVLLITLLVSRLNLDSRNNNKPPSSDPNRKKVSRKKGDKRHNFARCGPPRTGATIKVLKTRWI